jgi:hypothetical protein
MVDTVASAAVASSIACGVRRSCDHWDSVWDSSSIEPRLPNRLGDSKGMWRHLSSPDWRMIVAGAGGNFVPWAAGAVGWSSNGNGVSRVEVEAPPLQGGGGLNHPMWGGRWGKASPLPTGVNTPAGVIGGGHSNYNKL